MLWYAIFPATFALQALLVAVYVARARRGGTNNEAVGSVLAVVLLVMWIVVVMPFRA